MQSHVRFEQSGWGKNVVPEHEADRSFQKGDAKIARFGGAAVFLSYIPDGQGSLCEVVPHLPRRRIGAAIVDNDDLKVREGLIFEVGQAFQKSVGAVICRNDNAQRSD